MTTDRKRDTEEFKREAVRLMETSGKPIVQLARDLGINDNKLYRWRGVYGSPSQDRTNGSVAEMEAELKRLRLYPPAWMLARETIEAVTLGGYPIRKGTPILLSPYVLHRDPRWWDEPETFRPERFHPENEARIPRYAYIPFGSGPRVCIGNQFAMMEAQLLLATIAQRFRLALVPGHPIELEPLITLRSLHGMAMTVHAHGGKAQPTPTAAAHLPA